MHDKNNTKSTGNNTVLPTDNTEEQTPMDTSGNIPSDDVSFLHVSIPIINIIKLSESLAIGCNHLKDYLIDKFSLTFHNVTILGKKDGNLFIAHFKGH